VSTRALARLARMPRRRLVDLRIANRWAIPIYLAQDGEVLRGMRIQTIRAMLFVLVLTMFAADVSVGCGSGYVYGQVTQKYRTGGDAMDFIIAVNGQTFNVPATFYQSVFVGDWVRFNGKDWVKAKPPTNPPTLQQ
jgi:hypothetical protein